MPKKMSRINQKLLDALEKESGLKKSQVYNLVGKVSGELLLPRNLAALVVASRRGLNINKYATLDELSTIRQTQSSQNASITVGATSAPKSSLRKPKTDGGFTDPFIDASIVSSANRNAELYPIMFIFENSVRNVVSMVMQNAHGEDWWEKKIHLTIKNGVKVRQAEEKQSPWHSQRGAAPIYYTDISDLRKIINTFNKEFKLVFGKIPRVEMWIEEIEKTRNILAHNNPVSKKDRDRLTVFARDWSELAKKIFDEIC
jgi:Swt1-like HEPN